MLHKFPIVRPLGGAKLNRPKGARIFTPENDTLFLLWISSLTSGNIVEIGANTGVTTYHLATFNPNKIIYAVEPAPDDRAQIPAQQLHSAPEKPFHWCKDLANVKTLAVSSGDLNYAEMENVTMVFIDGDHTYEGVKADCQKALTHLKQSSASDRFIVWHDYTPNPHLWLGVGAYLNWDLWNKLEIYYVPGTSIAFTRL